MGGVALFGFNAKARSRKDAKGMVDFAFWLTTHFLRELVERVFVSGWWLWSSEI